MLIVEMSEYLRDIGFIFFDVGVFFLSFIFVWLVLGMESLLFLYDLWILRWVRFSTFRWFNRVEGSRWFWVLGSSFFIV